MLEVPNILVSGSEARLFPILAETSREKRVASILLAVMTQIPALADIMLETVGVRIGKRTKVNAFTEVVLQNEVGSGCRPDGLIVVNTGRSTWTALVEAKIGKAKLEIDQVQRYIALAKANNIDAVITLSNEFVARASHSPVSIPKTMLRKINLFHWSWSWILTQSEILAYRKAVDDLEQVFLLEQLNHFLSHSATGIERFTQMGSNWKDVVQSVSNDQALKKTDSEVQETLESWFAEERDLCLHMSSHVGLEVSAKIDRKLLLDPVERLKQGIVQLVSSQTLSMVITVPDSASDITICADIGKRTIMVSMVLKSPTDRKSTKARVNWVLRMLKQDDPRLLVRAHWPGRAKPTTIELFRLRDDASLIQTDNVQSAPHGFEVILIERLGKRFAGRKTFIEDLERIVTEFYDLVGVNLKAWQAAPPRPIKIRDDLEHGEQETEAQ